MKTKALLTLILAGVTLFATACGENEEYGLCIISSEGTAGYGLKKKYSDAHAIGTSLA